MSLLKRQQGSKLLQWCLADKKQGKPMLARQSLALRHTKQTLSRKQFKITTHRRPWWIKHGTYRVKRCYSLLSPSLHYNINKIPNWTERLQCYFLMCLDSNCNVLSYLPLLCTALKHTTLPSFIKLDSFNLLCNNNLFGFPSIKASQNGTLNSNFYTDEIQRFCNVYKAI